MPSLVPLDGLLGCLFIGTLISTIIYGITCLQVYLYYTEYCSKDRAPLKIFVAAIMILDTVHVMLLAHLVYHYTVTNFGDYEELTTGVWSFNVQVLFGAISGFCVQMFYVRRVYILSGGRRVIPMFVIVVALVQFGSSLAFIIHALKNPLFEDSLKNTTWSMTALGLDIVRDTFITVSMIYYLLKTRTTLAKTNRVINLLITYVLNTCLLTTIFTATCLTLYEAVPKTLVYVPFYFILVRLYTCSFMSTLNCRAYIRQKVDVTMNSSVSGMIHGMVTMPTFDMATRTSDANSRDETTSTLPTRMPTRSSTGVKDVLVFRNDTDSAA